MNNYMLGISEYSRFSSLNFNFEESSPSFSQFEGGMRKMPVIYVNPKRKEVVVTIPNAIIFQSSINTNDTKTTDQIIHERVEYLHSKTTPFLISLIRNEDYDFGQSSESIRLVEDELKHNEFAAKEWFNRLFVQYFSSKTETNILIGLLRIVEFLNERFVPDYQTMALASLSHHSHEVKELGVRILEATCCLENLKILKSIQTGTKWLQEYINQVIDDFEQILCPS